MATNRPARAIPADPPEVGTDLPLDHALSLLLADETENALRWGAAVLESGPWTPSALVVTARLLDQMGRRRAAIEGLNLAVKQSITEGNLPLAMAAIGDLRSFGAEVAEPLEQTAAAFCEGSDRIRDVQTAPLLPQFGEFRPLSPFLTGPALASKAAQIVETVRRTEPEDTDAAPSRFAPLPLFSALAKESLHDLLAAFDTVTVPAGHAVIREGEEEAAAYIVARGELEVSRRSSDHDGKPIVLARLGSGAFFGEMALLSQLPGAASVIATRPSILLVARREALEAVVEKHPDVAVELAAHCRRQSVANLGWASPVVVAIPPRERATLVERFETRMFEAGDKLVEAGEEARGLHLIVSGEIGVVATEGGERLVLATLTAGETVGEVELVLCRNSAADAVAIRPTATLFLPREEFFTLVQDHPAILHGLYGIAVRRHAETSLALEAGSSTMTDDSFLADVPDDLPALVSAIHAERPSDGRAEGKAAARSRFEAESQAQSLVEDMPAEVEDVPRSPQRITPLARGTLSLPRSSAPPPRTSTIPPPRASTVPPPIPVSANAPRNTLPLPPVPTPPASLGTTTGRMTAPPAIPASARPKDLPRVSTRSPSFAPITAAVGPRASSAETPHRPITAGRIALVAVAAGAVIAFGAMRGLGDRAPAATPSTPAANPIAATILPPPSVVVSAAPEPAATAPTEAPRPAASKPKAYYPPAAVHPVKVVVEPNPSPGAATGGGAPSAASAQQTPIPRQPVATAKPAAADPPAAAEFGGRE
jgi:CRP-like cAMP-binding protein